MMGHVVAMLLLIAPVLYSLCPPCVRLDIASYCQQLRLGLIGLYG
jgi:hypothetical protein